MSKLEVLREKAPVSQLVDSSLMLT